MIVGAAGGAVLGVAGHAQAKGVDVGVGMGVRLGVGVGRPACMCQV